MREHRSSHERERTTLRDVADRVGVSVNTASFVLNGSRSGTRVSTTTREALLAAATELGYRPNEVARALQRQSTRMVGLFTQFEHLRAGNAFLAELIGGMQEACAFAGHDLVLHSIPHDCDTQSLVQSLSDCRIDGLVMFAPEGRELAEALAHTALPVVSVAEPMGSLSTVGVDDEAGGRLQAQHLFAKGHRCVVYRTWHADIPSAKLRLAAFKETARELGLEVVPGKITVPNDDGALTAQERLALETATAFACWSDDAAQATCAALSREGVCVPDDVAVIGFDGVPARYVPRWQLTTIRAPWHDVGARAVKRVLDGGEAPNVERLPVSLFIGSTT